MSLLEAIKRGLVDRITPRFTPDKGYDYCGQLEELGIGPCDNIMEEIREYVELGILEKRVYDRVASCPKCGSEAFLVKARCPYCGSPMFRDAIVLEHLTCGYVGLEKEFLTKDGKLVCPKCGKKLKGLGIDFLRIANVKICEKCGGVFSAPSLTYKCLRCGHESRELELKTKYIYEYVVAPKELRGTRPVLLMLLRALKEKLPEGYEVLGPYVDVEASSGVKVKFAVAVKKADGNGVLAAIDVAKEIDKEALLVTFAKARTAGVKHVIVAFAGKVDENIARLAESLGLRILRLDDIDEIAEAVKEIVESEEP